MVQALEGSLKRLNTDYIDVYYVHVWDMLTPIEETMRALDDLVRAGKVLYVGISDAPAWVVARANTLAEHYGWSPFVSLSLQYNLVERSGERELLPMAEALDLGVTAWSPLSFGLLSGKYTRGTEGGRLNDSGFQSLNFLEQSERNMQIAQTVQQLADELRCTPAQLALAWLRQQANGIIPIISGRTVAQIKENLDCLDLTLSQDVLNRLDGVSRVPLGFPMDFLKLESVLYQTYGGLFDSIDSDRLNLLRRLTRR